MDREFLFAVKQRVKGEPYHFAAMQKNPPFALAMRRAKPQERSAMVTPLSNKILR